MVEGARVVALRSQLLATLSGTGAMALLELSGAELSATLAGYPGVEVAAYNGPAQVAVAGEPDQVRELVARVEARGLLAKLIKSTVAGHSMLVDPVVGALTDGLRDLAPRAPHTRSYSTVLDDPRTAPAFDAAYWAANIRRPVRFAQAIAAAAADGHTRFVEISPHPVLSHALTDNARAGGVPQPVVLGSGRRCDDETSHFHAQLTALMLAGGGLPAVESEGARLVDLPRTRWRHTRHWLQPQSRRLPVAAHPLLGDRIELPGVRRPMWQSTLDPVDPQTAGGDRWVALSTWLDIAHSAAAEALRRNGREVLVRDLVLHEPRALGDHCTLSTSIELTSPWTGILTVHSRIGRGAWREHVSATVETLTERRAATPADPDASFEVVLPARHSDERAAHGSSRVVELALSALVDALGLAGAGTWLPRCVGHARWLGELDEVLCATVCSSEVTDAGELTATLQLTGADGSVRLELGAVTLRQVAAAQLLMALPEKLLRLDWHAVKAPRAPVVHGRWFLIGDASDPRAGELATGLLARGAKAHVIDRIDAEATLRDDHMVDGVVLLVAPSPPHGDPELGPGRGEALVLDCTRIVRALSERTTVGAPRTRLYFATSGAAAVADGDQPDPGPAALRGLVRVLAYEHPELEPTWVDLEPGREVEDLLDELGATDAEDEVAWRAGHRHVARLVRPEPAELTTDSARTVRPDGAYLVSGGLGGLGLVLARWLAESGAARIVLNGRSAPGPDVERVLAQLRELGSEVTVVNGDITQPGVAEQAVAACTAPGARLRGVIHAAAAFEDGVAMRLDPDSLHRVWAAKAAGAWRLSAATADIELAWWVGFSSAAALIGSPGQAAYAAANAYLDALVAWRRAHGMVGSTINWGTWSQVGQAAQRSADAVSPITPAEGLEALEALLLAQMPAAGVLKLDPSALVDAFPDLGEIPLLSRLLGPAGARGERAGSDWPGVAGLDPAQAPALISARINERIAGVLGVEAGRLDADVPLTALGLDSLLAVRIRNALQHDFDLLLPPSLMLRGASIDDVVAWVCDTLHLAPASPAAGTASPGPARVPPRDASERIVAAVWEEILGRSGFGVTENFYDLGGDRAGPDRLSELMTDPTIERQASLLREPESASRSPLRLLRQGSGPATLFLFHPGGGDTLVYRQLIEQLDPSVTVWGLDRLPDVFSVEERAERYVELLRERQRNGPYLLGGWSFGGALAYETGLRLEAAGERIELLAMIDTILALPDPPGTSEVEILERRFQRFASFMEESYGKPVSLPYERMARLGDEAQADVLIETIVAAGLLDPVANAAILAHQRTSYLDVRALEGYRPGRLDARVVLFSARDMQTAGMRDPRFDRQDPARGWDAVCGDELDIVTVPGHHLSLLDPPNVDELAARLNELLVALGRVAA